MAGTVMHLVIADRLMDQYEIKNPAYFYCGNLAPDAVMNRENYVREMKRHTHFKDGIRLNEFRIPENFTAYMERLNAFYEALVAKPSKHWEIYFGYLTHILVDELYLLRFRDGFVDMLVEQGKEPTDLEFFRIFTKDVYLVDLELVRTYKFRHPMPDTLRMEEEYEIPGLVTAKELKDSKEYIIHMNFEPQREKSEEARQTQQAAGGQAQQAACDDAQSRQGEDMTDPDVLRRFYFPEVSGTYAGELKVMTLQQNLDFIELCVREIPKLLRERYGIAPQKESE
ncbi:MAG: zinc dependent phospholipase C family protein [Lachnospiraceae bacterium]|nr:zinc dependent phospholipase C family protein [Lachnospiraceae bacterium]